MKRFYVVVPKTIADRQIHLLNNSVYSSYDKLKTVGSQNQFYVIGFNAKSKSQAPEVYKRFQIMDRDEIKAYLAGPFEATYSVPNPEPVLNTLGDNLGFGFDGKKKSIVIPDPVANPITDHDLYLDKAYALQGGGLYIHEGFTILDSVIAQVVDVDGNYSPPGTVLGQYLDWFVAPKKYIVATTGHDVSHLPANVYLRIKYESKQTQTAPVKGFVNYQIYEIQ